MRAFVEYMNEKDSSFVIFVYLSIMCVCVCLQKAQTAHLSYVTSHILFCLLCFADLFASCE